MMYKFLATALAVLMIAGCSWVVVDPRTPEDRDATHAAMTATAQLVPTVTLTPEPPPLPTVGPDVHPEAVCVVKGNVSAAGVKIYHVKGQANYNQVIIDPEHGEKCFDTEEEAVAAGWRKAQR